MRLIDADALNKAFDKSEAIEEIYGSDGLPVISEVIDAAPTIDAEPVRHGKWIDKSGGIEGAWNHCSVCGERAIELYDYCPNCGAKMEEAEP